MKPDQVAKLLEFKCENLRRDAERHRTSADHKNSPGNDYRRGYADACDHLADLLGAIGEIIMTETEEMKP